MKLRIALFSLVIFSSFAVWAAGMWSTTLYSDPNNGTPPYAVTLPNVDYLMLAPRNSWAPSGYPVTKVQWNNFEVGVDNTDDATAVRVQLCSRDRWLQLGVWTCTTLKSAGAVLAVGACNANYCRPNTYTLKFNGNTTFFNSIHMSDNGGYIARIRHVPSAAAPTPTDTTLVNGSIFNYW